MCLRQFIFLKHSSEGQWLLENETLKKKFLYAIILKYLKNSVFLAIKSTASLCVQ